MRERLLNSQSSISQKEKGDTLGITPKSITNNVEILRNFKKEGI